MDEIFKKLKDSWAQRKANADATMAQVNKDAGLEVQPGDESQFNDTSNLRNIMIDKLGLDPEWKMNLADEKNHYADMPKEMGMAAMGSIAKVAGPEAAMQKIISKIQNNQGLNTAEQLMLNETKIKAGLSGNPRGGVTVQDSVADVAAKKAMEKIKDPVDMRSIVPEPSASVINPTSDGTSRLMAPSPSLDQLMQGNAGRFQGLIKNKN